VPHPRFTAVAFVFQVLCGEQLRTIDLSRSVIKRRVTDVFASRILRRKSKKLMCSNNAVILDLCGKRSRPGTREQLRADKILAWGIFLQIATQTWSKRDMAHALRFCYAQDRFRAEKMNHSWVLGVTASSKRTVNWWVQLLTMGAFEYLVGFLLNGK